MTATSATFRCDHNQLMAQHAEAKSMHVETRLALQTQTFRRARTNFHNPAAGRDMSALTPLIIFIQGVLATLPFRFTHVLDDDTANC